MQKTKRYKRTRRVAYKKTRQNKRRQEKVVKRRQVGRGIEDVSNDYIKFLIEKSFNVDFSEFYNKNKNKFTIETIRSGHDLIPSFLNSLNLSAYNSILCEILDYTYRTKLNDSQKNKAVHKITLDPKSCSSNNDIKNIVAQIISVFKIIFKFENYNSIWPDYINSVETEFKDILATILHVIRAKVVFLNQILTDSNKNLYYPYFHIYDIAISKMGPRPLVTVLPNFLDKYHKSALHSMIDKFIENVQQLLVLSENDSPPSHQ